MGLLEDVASVVFGSKPLNELPEKATVDIGDLIGVWSAANSRLEKHDARLLQSDYNETDSAKIAFIQNKPINTSDFTNDGEGGTPFITEDDLPDVAGQDGRNYNIARDNDTEDVAPTTDEITEPKAGDTATVTLSNGVVELYSYTTTWAKDSTVTTGISIKDHLGSVVREGTDLTFSSDFGIEPITGEISLISSNSVASNVTTTKIFPTNAFKKFDHSGTSNVGAISIRLPSWVNNFVDILISTQGYSGNTGHEFVIKAFNRNDTNFTRWEQETVFLSPNPTGSPSIRLGRDATHAYIFIGELTDNWLHSYAVTIKEITVGGYGTNSVDSDIINSLKGDTWVIDLESSAFPTIDHMQAT